MLWSDSWTSSRRTPSAVVRLRAREGTLSRKSTVCTELNFTEFCFVLFGRNSKFLFCALQLVTCQSGQHLHTYSELCIAQLCASCACGLSNIWNSLHSEPVRCLRGWVCISSTGSYDKEYIVHQVCNHVVCHKCYTQPLCI